MDVPKIEWAPGELDERKALDVARRRATTAAERYRLSKHAGFAEKFLKDVGAKPTEPVKWLVLATMLESIMRAMEERDDAIAALEAKAAPTLKYCGVWTAGTTYGPGAFVTHKGDLWHCNTLTTAPPGGAEGQWTLAVRRGRDGRDADGRRGR